MGGGEHVSMESMHGLVGIRVLVCVYVCGEGGRDTADVSMCVVKGGAGYS